MCRLLFIIIDSTPQMCRLLFIIIDSTPQMCRLLFIIINSTPQMCRLLFIIINSTQQNVAFPCECVFSYVVAHLLTNQNNVYFIILCALVSLWGQRKFI